MKKYFMSYVYSIVYSTGSEKSYGSLAYEGDEHPIAKVNRWNKAIKERTTVLLYWKELTDEEYIYMEVETT